jgi:hypothetical protein
MEEILNIQVDKMSTLEAEDFLSNLSYETGSSGLKVYREVEYGKRSLDMESIVKLLVSLGSIGALKLVVNFLKIYSEKNKDKKIVLTNKDKSISVEGYDMDDVNRILHELKLFEQETKPAAGEDKEDKKGG